MMCSRRRGSRRTIIDKARKYAAGQTAVAPVVSIGKIRFPQITANDHKTFRLHIWTVSGGSKGRGKEKYTTNLFLRQTAPYEGLQKMKTARERVLCRGSVRLSVASTF
jgi:hypothetical protein